MAQKLAISNVAGRILENPEEVKVFVKSLTAIKGRKIIIFSTADAGKKMGKKMGTTVRFSSERPVMDEATLNLYAMVYGGMVSSQFVTLLQSYKINAAGFTGADMNFVTSTLQAGDTGLTGVVHAINTQAFSDLVEQGVVPVIAPFSHDGKGQMLFNETDAMASEIAKSLAIRYDVTLMYCFQRKGVLLNVDDPDSVIPVLKRTQYKNMREMEIIKDWFANKLDNAFSAVDHGVKEVVISSAAGLGKASEGTHIK